MTTLAPISEATPQAISLETLRTAQPKFVTLTPVTMLFANRHCVYSPHPERGPKQLSYAEFQARYGRYPATMRVCFAPADTWQSLYEQSVEVTAFGFGLEGWFIVSGFSLT